MRRGATLWIALALPLAGASMVCAQSALPPGASSPDAPLAQTNPLNGAESLLAAGNYAAAREQLLPYLSAHPADARALFDLGYAEQASGDTQAAQREYRKALAANPLQFEAHSALGLLLASEGKNTEAIEQLRDAGSCTPNPPDGAAQAENNRALARLLEPSDPEAARLALIAALKEAPETVGDSLLAAEIATREGEPDAAADAYGKALAEAPATSPEHAQAAAGLAHLLIQAKRYPEAEAVLRKALIGSPTDPPLNTELADVLASQDKKTDAIAILKTLNAAHPDDVAIGGMLAQLETETGDNAGALHVLQPLVAAHPADPALLAQEGDAMVHAGEFAEALPVLEQATRINPKDGEAWSSLAFAASQQHQPDLVIQALQARAKVMSETPATYFLAATAYDSLHQTKQAAALYRQFLAVAGNGFPDEIWQARQRLQTLSR